MGTLRASCCSLSTNVVCTFWCASAASFSSIFLPLTPRIFILTCSSDSPELFWLVQSREVCSDEDLELTFSVLAIFSLSSPTDFLGIENPDAIWEIFLKIEGLV